MNLLQAIHRNRRREKYRRLLRRLTLRVFDYEDGGQLEKYEQVRRRVRILAGYEDDDEERRLMGNLLRSHPRFGQTALSINQCLRHRSIPTPIKRAYVEFMRRTYPTSHFNFPEV